MAAPEPEGSAPLPALWLTGGGWWPGQPLRAAMSSPALPGAGLGATGLPRLPGG